MIPAAQITQWRNIAPWPDDMQVEQDLILSRILADIFSNDFLKNELAFRGGTALHKLFISPAARYSEDIDLVRTSKGPITPIVDTLREILEPWLGKAKTKRTGTSFKLFFYFNPETLPDAKLRIKIEINIKETFSVLNYIYKNYAIRSDWHSITTDIKTFELDEIIATKIRALYQRSKGRDLFDLWLALKKESLNLERTINTFKAYMDFQDKKISRDNFEDNLNEKLADPDFLSDIAPLLSPNLIKSHSKPIVSGDGNLLFTENGGKVLTEGWNLIDAADEVRNKIISKMT